VSIVVKPMKKYLLEINNLTIEFSKDKSFLDYFYKNSKNTLRAVDNVNLSISRGEILGLVGESGSGKSSLIKALVGINKIKDGKVLYLGKEINYTNRKIKKFLSKKFQVVFQDPYSSLNPAMTIFSALKEVVKFHNNKMDSHNIKEKVISLLSMVGFSKDLMYRKPKSLSGGQRQRVGIARALAVEPEILLLDEPVTALDVSIQAQILNLLKELNIQLNLTMIFVAHELPVIDFMCEKVAVMHLGRIVEFGNKKEIFNNPKDPYTIKLIQSIPKLPY
tara:strand:+ start:534 stop:1364 length:831 start_codon:yes stop_codon:yes gene_type:complete